MRARAIAGLLIMCLIFPAGLFAQNSAPPVTEPESDLEAPAEAVQEVTPEEEISDAEKEKIERNKLIAGVSLSAAGAILTVVGGLFADELEAAELEYYSFDGSGSLDDLKSSQKEVTKYRLAHYIPMITGLVLSGIGLVVALDGSGGMSIYERGPYSPNISNTSAASELIISPGFTGFILRN